MPMHTTSVSEKRCDSEGESYFDLNIAIFNEKNKHHSDFKINHAVA